MRYVTVNKHVFRVPGTQRCINEFGEEIQSPVKTQRGYLRPRISYRRRRVTKLFDNDLFLILFVLFALAVAYIFVNPTHAIELAGPILERIGTCFMLLWPLILGAFLIWLFSD